MGMVCASQELSGERRTLQRNNPPAQRSWSFGVLILGKGVAGGPVEVTVDPVVRVFPSEFSHFSFTCRQHRVYIRIASLFESPA